MLYEPHRYTRIPFVIKKSALSLNAPFLKNLNNHNLHQSPFITDSINPSISGNAFFFQPIPGIHFGSCGPAVIHERIVNEFSCGGPYIYAQLVLSGTCEYAIGHTRTKPQAVEKNMFYITRWEECSGKSLIPAQKEYSHMGIMVEESAFVQQFGEHAYEAFKLLLKKKDAGGEAERPVAVGLSSPTTLAMARKLLSLIRLRSTGYLRIRCGSLEFFACLISDLSRKTVTPPGPLHARDARRLAQLKEYIDRNYLACESIAELCASIGMSESKANKGFKHLYNLTIAKYIHHCKMQYAYEALVDNACNVTECAFTIGYSNVGHFITAFKRYFSMTPKNAMYLQK